MSFIKEIEKNLSLKAKIKYLPLQKGDVPETSCNTAKIKKVLNYVPHTNYKVGIKSLLSGTKHYLKVIYGRYQNNFFFINLVKK